MENVPDAPVPHVDGYEVEAFILNNRWLGQDQNRLRRSSFGRREGAKIAPYLRVSLFESPVLEEAVLASDSRRVSIKLGGSGKPKRSTLNTRTRQDMLRVLELQGVPHWQAEALTVEGQYTVLGNGVPVPMSYALAEAITEETRGLTP